MEQDKATKADEAAEAEDQVIHSTLRKSVTVCGISRSLKPLPQFYAKQISSVLNNVVKGFQEVASAATQEGGRAPTSVLAGQEERLTQAFTDCLVILGGFYKWNLPKDAEDIEKVMTATEIKNVVQAQVEVNSDDDFLLIPQRLISQVLSQTAKVGREDGNPATTPVLEKPGASDLLN